MVIQSRNLFVRIPMSFLSPFMVLIGDEVHTQGSQHSQAHSQRAKSTYTNILETRVDVHTNILETRSTPLSLCLLQELLTVLRGHIDDQHICGSSSTTIKTQFPFLFFSLWVKQVQAWTEPAFWSWQPCLFKTEGMSSPCKGIQKWGNGWLIYFLHILTISCPEKCFCLIQGLTYLLKRFIILICGTKIIGIFSEQVRSSKKKKKKNLN